MIARAALRNALRATKAPTPLSQLGARRGYAEAVSDKLKFNFTLPHQALYHNVEVTQVNVPALAGEMGILASHVPSVEQLGPGVVEVIQPSGTKKYFCSSGFATMHPDNTLAISAVEAYELDKFSVEAVRSALSEAQRVVSSGASAEAKAEAEIEVELYTALQAALGRS